MERLISVGRVFFALGLIGLGIEHFIFREFVTGRAPPWPAGIAGGAAWAYVTGAAFMGAGAALVIGRVARQAAIFVAALIFAWALLRHIPVVAADSFLGATWTPVGKAWTFVGGSLAIAATLPPLEPRSDSLLVRFVNRQREFIVVGRVALGLFLIVTGIQHYLFTEFVATLVPGWIPGGGVFWTWAAGVFLIAGGVGLHVPRTARLAALLSGLMVFSWFWIVHLPRTFDGMSSAIAVFEALAVSGIAFVLAGWLAVDGATHARRGTVVEEGAGVHAG